tara:strand:+ start:22187 stop:22693 length:507 start_codon:yes stop_codon:yes gene_type:complete
MSKKATAKPNVSNQVRELYEADPDITSREVITKLKCTPKAAYSALYYLRKNGVNKVPLKRGRPAKPQPLPLPSPSTISGEYALYMATSAKQRMQSAERIREVQVDPINHPPHYKVGGIETIDFIEAKKLNYNLGNVAKYITRADHKGNKLEDLRKAQWYLTREINSLI